MAPQNCHPDRSEAQWRDLLFHSDQQQIPTLNIPLANLQVMTTFPTCLWQVEKEMTLQNRHGSEARRADCKTSAQPGRAGRRIAKIVERWRRGTTYIRGAAPPALGRCAESMSQPSRAGLMFGYRPYGPGSDLRFIAGYHTPSSVLGCFYLLTGLFAIRCNAPRTDVLGYSQPSLRDSIWRG